MTPKKSKVTPPTLVSNRKVDHPPCMFCQQTKGWYCEFDVGAVGHESANFCRQLPGDNWRNGPFFHVSNATSQLALPLHALKCTQKRVQGFN